MQIGFDAKRLFYNKTGLGNYSRNLVQNLHRYYPDNTFHLFAPRPIPAHPFFSETNFKLHQNARTPSGFWRSWLQARDWTKQGIQVYHGLSNELPFTVPKGVKSIVTIHDLIFKTLPTTYPTIDRWIYDKKVKASCTIADVIITVSQQTKEDLYTYYGILPEKIKVIHPPVHRAYYELETTPEVASHSVIHQLPKQYFLCVGSLEQRKNQLQLLKAWRRLASSFQLPIVLVGRGKQYAEELKSYAKEHQIPVYFLEQITKLEELMAIYQRATVFIYPSLYEGFGLPVVEAQLSRVPVITSKYTALKEAASPTSKLIDPTSTEELAVAITHLLSNQEIYEHLKEEGRTYSLSAFHPKKLTADIWDLYH